MPAPRRRSARNRHPTAAAELARVGGLGLQLVAAYVDAPAARSVLWLFNRSLTTPTSVPITMTAAGLAPTHVTAVTGPILSLRYPSVVATGAAAVIPIGVTQFTSVEGHRVSPSGSVVLAAELDPDTYCTSVQKDSGDPFSVYWTFNRAVSLWAVTPDLLINGQPPTAASGWGGPQIFATYAVEVAAGDAWSIPPGQVSVVDAFSRAALDASGLVIE